MSSMTQVRLSVKPARVIDRGRSPRRVRPAHGVCRLSLAINGTLYQVRPVECHPSAALRCYALSKADGTAYHVSQHVHGPECDCPDFVFHRDGIDPAGCKHVKALAVFGMVTPGLPPIRGGSPTDDARDSQATHGRAGRSGTDRAPSDPYGDHPARRPGADRGPMARRPSNGQTGWDDADVRRHTRSVG